MEKKIDDYPFTLDILQKKKKKSHKLGTTQHNENKLSISPERRETQTHWASSKDLSKAGLLVFLYDINGKEEVQLHPISVPTR